MEDQVGFEPQRPVEICFQELPLDLAKAPAKAPAEALVEALAEYHAEHLERGHRVVLGATHLEGEGRSSCWDLDRDR